jgi:hypothetical protein
MTTQSTWTRLCKRTNDPKLADVERQLALLGIPSRRNGRSFHAPILEVPEMLHEEAHQRVLLAPDPEWIIYDDVPDDDPRFSPVSVRDE